MSKKDTLLELALPRNPGMLLSWKFWLMLSLTDLFTKPESMKACLATSVAEATIGLGLLKASNWTPWGDSCSIALDIPSRFTTLPA